MSGMFSFRSGQTGDVTMMLFIKMLVRVERKRAAQLAHDLAGVHICVQRSKRSNADRIIPYPIKPGEIAVQIEFPVRSKGKTGQKVKFRRIKFHLRLTFSYCCAGLTIVQNGFSTVKVTSQLGPVDHSLKQPASLACPACWLPLSHGIILPHTD